jgi:hypothetical protein
MEFWKMVLAGIIAGVVSSGIGALALNMAWGRIMDRFERIEAYQEKCSAHFEGAVCDLYNRATEHGERISKLGG